MSDTTPTSTPGRGSSSAKHLRGDAVTGTTGPGVTGTSGTTGTGVPQRATIPPPADEEVVFRVGDHDERAPHRRRVEVLATIGGALAALGTLLLLSSLVGTAGTIGFQRGVDGQDLSIGGLVAGLVVLFLACLVGGWVAGRIAHHHGGLHGLLAVVWLVLLAGVLAALAAIFGDDVDVTDRVGLPSWFSEDALTTTAIISGVVALLLALLGGWLGGRLAQRHRHEEAVEVVETRRSVREHPGGIVGTRGTR